MARGIATGADRGVKEITAEAMQPQMDADGRRLHDSARDVAFPAAFI